MSVNNKKQPMPEQAASERRHNFSEVALGYDQVAARVEAERCLQCKVPACRKGCPVGIDIPAFVKLIVDDKPLAANAKIREKNSLPAVCGRVCPQEDQCEKLCVLGKKGEPVAIGRLERYVADYAMAHEDAQENQNIAIIKKENDKNNLSVAVVGSGPAGLTLAGELVSKGYSVTVFEALHLSGGVLMYGIPEFRLPKAIVQREIETLRQNGVKFEVNTVVGRTVTIDELLEEGFNAVFIGTGAGLPHFMNIAGENLNGVYAANEFLTRSNLMKAYLFPQVATPIYVGKRVAVIGGGNVAMDAARTALRLGAEEVYLVYRRSEAEMPARLEELHHAKEEGVEFKVLTNPIEIIGNADGWVEGLRLQKMALGEPDGSGRRRPMAIPDSEFVLPVDVVVMAIGQGPNPLIQSTTRDMSTNKKGYIVTDEATGATTKTGVFAGGDIVTGAATVILAMGAGLKAAQAIDDFLQKNSG